jgi:metal-dependent HD superfamily phosphatase/phosphodiesterase
LKSPKEIAMDGVLLRKCSGLPLRAAEILVNDPEVQHMQDYANVVAIKRLGYNDHGPVHMRQVVLNALRMVDLLAEAGVKLNLEREEIGTLEDSRLAVLVACFLHDVGMTIGREAHEHTGVWIALPIIDRVLAQVYPDDLGKRVITRSLIVEGIVGHMGVHRIHSLEAGLVMIADGCDMEKGRARIPMLLAAESRMGDIHKHSATAIERVRIAKGEEKPIRIHVEMNASIGLFQVEEVLLKKIDPSPAKPYVELVAERIGGEIKRYL